jgi:hypothetical protein
LVATNGLVHGTPPVRIQGWHHSDTLIVQVDDIWGIPIPPMTYAVTSLTTEQATATPPPFALWWDMATDPCCGSAVASLPLYHRLRPPR